MDSKLRVSGRIRVATMNVWGHQGAWAERQAVLRAGLSELQPDVVAFQEVVNHDGYDQALDLLGSTYHVVHLRGQSADGVGAAIASRWPVSDLQERALDVTSRVDPMVGWIGSVAVAAIDAPEPTGALVLVHHKPSWQWGFEHERELQAVASARFIDEVVGQPTAHVILAGDFDADPSSASVRFWSGRQSLHGTSVCYQDAWQATHPGEPGHTFSPVNPLVTGGEMRLERGRRIDYILVRCGVHGPTLDIAACERIFDEPVDGVWASDHFGLVADLVLPGR